MFKLKKQAAMFKGMNVRTELHGEEEVSAIDLTVQFSGPATMLDHLDRRLRRMFYCKLDPESGDQIDIDYADDHAPDLVLPQLCKKEIAYDYEGIGYRVMLHVGIDEESDIYLKPCKVNRIKILFKDDGKVELFVRVQLNPTTIELAHIARWLNHPIDITLEPPTLSAVSEL